MGFSGGSDGYKSACNAGDAVLIPGSGRYPGVGNGNPLQYSCLENPMDRGAWQAIVDGIAKESDTTERMNTHTHTNADDTLLGRQFESHVLVNVCSSVRL